MDAVRLIHNVAVRSNYQFGTYTSILREKHKIDSSSVSSEYPCENVSVFLLKGTSRD